MALVERCYEFTTRLPASERYELARQIRRSAVSIPSNVAEGYGRRTRGDYVRFLAVANGSLRELETQILIAQRLGFVEPPDVKSALDLCGQVGRMLIALHRRLTR